MTARDDIPPTCTMKDCDGEPKWALWMPRRSEWSRVQDAHETFDYSDGDLHPCVCDDCKANWVGSISDGWEWRNPREKLALADGGTVDDNREIVPAAGGGSIAVYTDRDIPGDTKSIETTCDRLREAVNEDLGDDYPSVHLHCDGDALAVTNHENALDPDAPALEDLSGVERCEAVKTPETAKRVLINRSYLTQTLDALDGTVEVHIESKVRPLILDDGTDRAVIAPLGPVEELRKEFREGDPVADGGRAELPHRGTSHYDDSDDQDSDLTVYERADTVVRRCRGDVNKYCGWSMRYEDEELDAILKPNGCIDADAVDRRCPLCDGPVTEDYYGLDDETEVEA